MGYKEQRRRNSINARDIVGGLQTGGSRIVSAGAAGGNGAGRTLLTAYENNGSQSVALPATTYTNAVLNMATAVQSSPEVGANVAPFKFTATEERTLWIEAEVVFTPSANSGRYVLAVQSGTTTSKADAVHTFAVVTRGSSRRLYLQGVVDMLMSDEMQIVLRAYNEGTSSEAITITEARVWVYTV